MATAVPTWTWAAFAAGIATLLVLDLRLVRRRAHALGVRAAAIQSAAWIALGLVFGVLVLLWRGSAAGAEYFSAYLLEESLSVDNVFAWALILAHFAVPTAYQRRVLFWGILGAIVLRILFILGGVSLLERFDWVMYVFGTFLLVTATRVSSCGTIRSSTRTVIRSGGSCTSGDRRSPSCRAHISSYAKEATRS